MNEQECVQCSQQIEQILNNQITQVTSYTDYLSEIKTAISTNKTQRINELLEEQQVKPEQIEKTQQQQAKILSEYGYEISDKGLNTCIQDCDNTAQLETLKSALTEKIKELENSLLINALLVQKSQQRVKQSIRLLSGHDLNNNVSSYSRNGDIENQQESKHTLAKA